MADRDDDSDSIDFRLSDGEEDLVRPQAPPAPVRHTTPTPAVAVDTPRQGLYPPTPLAERRRQDFSAAYAYAVHVVVVAALVFACFLRPTSGVWVEAGGRASLIVLYCLGTVFAAVAAVAVFAIAASASAAQLKALPMTTAALCTILGVVFATASRARWVWAVLCWAAAVADLMWLRARARELPFAAALADMVTRSVLSSPLLGRALLLFAAATVAVDVAWALSLVQLLSVAESDFATGLGIALLLLSHYWTTALLRHVHAFVVAGVLASACLSPHPPASASAPPSPSGQSPLLSASGRGGGFADPSEDDTRSSAPAPAPAPPAGGDETAWERVWAAALSSDPAAHLEAGIRTLRAADYELSAPAADDPASGALTPQGFLRAALTQSFGSLCALAATGGIARALWSLLAALRAAERVLGPTRGLRWACEAVRAAAVPAMRGSHRQAVVVLAMKGQSALPTARATWDKMTDRGLDAVLEQDCTHHLATLAARVPALVFALGLAGALQQSIYPAYVVLVLAGFCIGASVAAAMLTTLTAGVDAVFVCFAVSPGSLARADPVIFHRVVRVAEAASLEASRRRGRIPSI